MNTAVEAISPSQAKQNSLLGSRALDFFLMGGLSIIVWLPFYFGEGYGFDLNRFGLSIPILVVTFGYVINYPHFMASYKLAYGQGKHFALAHKFQLIVVPVLMLFLFMVAIVFWNQPVSYIQELNHFLADIGLQIRFGLYPNLGTEMIVLFVMFMFFSVGWHYSKQSFGAMMVYAKFDSYPLNTWQRFIIRYALLSVWWVNWLYANALPGSFDFFGLNVYRLHLPHLWANIAYILSIALFVGVMGIFAYHYVKYKILPSFNFLVPMFALFIWQLPVLLNPQYFIFIGFFHALQYLPFVAKVETTRYQKQHAQAPYKRFFSIVFLLILVQTSIFILIPNELDAWIGAEENLGFSVFLIAVAAFVNIHHYFIDNVLWRFENKEVRELLFD